MGCWDLISVLECKLCPGRRGVCMRLPNGVLVNVEIYNFLHDETCLEPLFLILRAPSCTGASFGGGGGEGREGPPGSGLSSVVRADRGGGEEGPVQKQKKNCQKNKGLPNILAGPTHPPVEL